MILTSQSPVESLLDASPYGSALSLPKPKCFWYTADLLVVNPYWQFSQPICPASAAYSSGDHCCNCMHQSTCKIHKCHCIQAGTPCQSAYAGTTAVITPLLQMPPSLFVQLTSWLLRQQLPSVPWILCWKA